MSVLTFKCTFRNAITHTPKDNKAITHKLTVEDVSVK